MKPKVEIVGPLFNHTKALAASEGSSVLDSTMRTAAEPFHLRDGSFKGGDGLQDGVRWADLHALAVSNGALLPGIES